METQDLFKLFIKTMNEILHENADTDGRNQKELLEDLFVLENKFREVLLSTQEGKKVYMDFIKFITEDKGNILSARVYFRERQDVFSNSISNAFKKVDPTILYNFHINYHFAKWVCDNYRGPKRRSLLHHFNKIIDVRKVLCENNIPLAINRAKIFWSRTPTSHLEYMDFIQNANEGLMNAIDKFVPPYKAVFRSVAIGRMTLNMLDDHNSTMVKFSPTERRILYRANNARVKAKLTEESKVLKYVKESFKNVTPNKLRDIMSAASGVSSLDYFLDDEVDTGASLIDVLESEDDSPEDTFLSKELMSKVNSAANNIPIIEQKILIMKFGVNFT